MMGIRQATEDDVARVCKLLAEDAHNESGNYQRLPVNEIRIKAALRNWLANPKVFFYVTDDVDGVFIGEIMQAWTHDGFMAINHAIYTKPGVNGLPLVKAFLAWARGWNAVNKIQLSVSFDHERAERAGKLFERLGLHRVGYQFAEVR